MARARYYYRLREAEKIKQTYSSWISKRAHLGEGKFSILKRISIKPRLTHKKETNHDGLFTIKFEFEDNRKIDACIFLINNGLATGIDTTPFPAEPIGQDSPDVNVEKN